MKKFIFLIYVEDLVKKVKQTLPNNIPPGPADPTVIRNKNGDPKISIVQLTKHLIINTI